MAERPARNMRDLTNLDLTKATDEELAELKRLTDDDLLRYSRTLDLFAVVESARRLKETLQTEEKAIKRLTFVLVALTVLLVVLTVILVGLGIVALRH